MNGGKAEKQGWGTRAEGRRRSAENGSAGAWAGGDPTKTRRGRKGEDKERQGEGGMGRKRLGLVKALQYAGHRASPYPEIDPRKRKLLLSRRT